VGRTLVVNLPGKPGSIRCCLDAVPPAPPPPPPPPGVR